MPYLILLLFFLSVHIPLPWSVDFFNYFSQELCCVPYHILALVHSIAARVSAVQSLALVYQTDTSVRMSAQLLNAVVIKATQTFLGAVLPWGPLDLMQVLSIVEKKNFSEIRKMPEEEEEKTWWILKELEGAYL